MIQDSQPLNRIVVNPDILAGKPVIQGTRLSVQSILNLLAHDETVDSILTEYPYLSKDDVLACVLFANRVLDDTSFVPLAKAT